MYVHMLIHKYMAIHVCVSHPKYSDNEIDTPPTEKVHSVFPPLDLGGFPRLRTVEPSGSNAAWLLSLCHTKDSGWGRTLAQHNHLPQDLAAGQRPRFLAPRTSHGTTHNEEACFPHNKGSEKQREMEVTVVL